MTRILSQSETPPYNANFTSKFFQKLVENKKRLEDKNNASYSIFLDCTGKSKCKQIVVVPPDPINQIFQSFDNDPLRSHPGSCKMLQELRKSSYLPNLSELVLQYVIIAKTAFGPCRSRKPQSHQRCNKIITLLTVLKTD